MITSWICSGLSAARSTAARIAAAPSCGAAKSFISPWNAPIGVRAAETMTTGSFNMVVSSLFHVKIESLLSDFDSPSSVGPFLGEHEAVAFVESACRIQARESGQKTDLHGARSRRLGKQLPSDQPAADLGSSRADLVELRVAPQAPGRVIVDVAHPAQALDCFAGHPGGFFRSVEDRSGGVLARGFVAVAGLPDRVDVGAAGVERRIHVGELSLHQLKLADRLAELLALMEVRDDHVHAGLHDAQGAAGEHRPLVIQS